MHSPSDPKTEPGRAENLEGLRLYLSGRTLAYHAWGQGEEFNTYFEAIPALIPS